MIDLQLEVRSEGLPFLKKNALYYHRTKVQVPAPLAGAVAALPPGPITAGCEYRPGGLVLVQLAGKTVEIEPFVSPAPAAKPSRDHDPRTRAELDALGEQSLPAVAHELIRGLEEMIQLGDPDRAAQVFPILMAAAERNPSMLVDPPSMAAIYNALPRKNRKAMQAEWLAWLTRHREIGTICGPDVVVPDIPFAEWPDELLFTGLAYRIARKENNVVLRGLLEEARRRAPHHANVAAGDALIEHAKGDVARRQQQEAEVRAARAREQMDAAPHVESVELAFKIKLPRELRGILLNRGGALHFTDPLLKELVARAETLRAKHLADDAPPAFLPLVEEGGATVGLYLTFPRPDGDFAVLALREGADPEIVAESSTTWFAARTDRASGR